MIGPQVSDSGGRGKLILVTGGARSGKSTFAEKLADELGAGSVLYIATAEILDDEMGDRVRRHRERRPATWKTVEAPKGLAEAVREHGSGVGAILIDCLTLYVSNLMLAETPDDELLAEIEGVAGAALASGAHVVIVTNEVGLGVVPAYELGRKYRDLAGWANQIVAKYADEVYLTVCGLPVELKSLGAATAAGLPAGAAAAKAPDIVGQAGGSRVFDGEVTGDTHGETDGVVGRCADGISGVRLASVRSSTSPESPARRCRAVMVQGTSSHVGKSVLVAALCRIFAQDGYRVAPYKSQNMALNSAVTPDGLEIGRAQGVQAEAAGIEPSVLMNPILIKPSGEMRAQIVVMGKPLADMDAMEYRKNYVAKGLEVAKDALRALMSEFDIVAIEGAGSPAEVNLKAGDIVNMRIAKLAKAPVLLVADVDKGGSLAAVVGTLALLEPDERDLVQGIVINKFRGDIRLFEDAVTFLEEYTGKPVLGVIPYLRDIGVDEEDSVSLDRSDDEAQTAIVDGEVVIGVVRLPCISNFTDFDALKAEPGVSVRFVTNAEEAEKSDCIIIPGTKNTMGDMKWFEARSFPQALSRFAGPIVGICGGYQILGEEIEEEGERVRGLGFLPTATEFSATKLTELVEVEATDGPLVSSGLLKAGEKLGGYEIHMGRTRYADISGKPLFRVAERSSKAVDDGADVDGCSSSDGRIWGTYLHGIFDNDDFRSRFVNGLRVAKGFPPQAASGHSAKQARIAAFNRLADHVRAHLDIGKLYSIMGLSGGKDGR